MMRITYLNTITNQYQIEIVTTNKMNIAKQYAKQFITHHKEYKLIKIEND